VTTTRLRIPALALALLLAAPAAAQAAVTFGAPATVGGFGNRPAAAQVNAAALSPSGAVTLAGSSDTLSGGVDNRRAALSFGATAQGFGPGVGAYGIAFAADASGHSALTWSVGHVAYLTTCVAARCSTQRAGSSALKPESAVAVQPRTGRTIVLWRGRTHGGVDRLQWRVTTNGRLGSTHTLGEFGDDPQLATDASGKTVAVWLADSRRGLHGVRTAARQKGEFLKPSTVTETPAADARVATSDDGDTVAAWLSGGEAGNPEGPSGTVQTATRTRTTNFGAPATLGPGSTVSLAEARDGFTAVVTTRPTAGGGTTVAASRRGPRGPFPPLADLATTGFIISTAYPPAVAVATGGRVLVSWASAGIFADVAEPGEPFGPVQRLATSSSANAEQPTGAAISTSRAAVAWAGSGGVQVAAG
jgi:hypothetical protein